MVYIWSSDTNLYLFIPRFFCLTKPQDISSQLVPWLTRTQVKQYLGSPLVPAMEKSTRNQSLGYELTFQQLLMKTRTQTYSLLYQDI